MRTLFGFSAVLALAACGAYHPAPVPVAGPPERIAALAGRWEGAYYGQDSRRFGSILFSIRTNGDSAFGDVLMEQNNGPTVAAGSAMAQRPVPTIPRVLSIRLVSVSDSTVRGRLERYTAPDCQCLVTTVFMGRQRGDSIVGTFITEAPALGSQTGSWGVVRKP